MKTDHAFVYAQEGSKEQMGVKILTYYNGQWWNHCTDRSLWLVWEKNLSFPFDGIILLPITFQILYKNMTSSLWNRIQTFRTIQCFILSIDFCQIDKVAMSIKISCNELQASNWLWVTFRYCNSCSRMYSTVKKMAAFREL